MKFIESETVELKSEVENDIIKEVVAFANSQGGTIYIGIENDGSITGIEDADKTILQINNMVRDSIKPDVTMFVHYDTIVKNNKNIISVTIQRGTNRPYYLASKGLRPSGVYVRNGNASDPSTDTAIRKMIKETDGDSFERMRSLEQNLTFETATKEFEERKIEFGKSQMKTLELLNLDDIYTNVGLLLSDQCTHTVKVATFQGVDQSEFKDRNEFGGSLFKQVEDAYNYIDLRNQTHSTFDKLRRVDRRDYPIDAVREALLNSLVHRDYAYSASTIISIFEDRIEFVSIGGLVSGLAVEDIMIGLSMCRNPKLAKVFYKLNFIEAYGTGMPKITRAYKDTGKKAKIEVTENAFKIILPNVNYNNSNAESPLNNITIEENLPTEYVKVLEFLNNNEFITRLDVENLLDVKQSTANRLLKKLQSQGFICQIGNGKKTKYTLKKS